MKKAGSLLFAALLTAVTLFGCGKGDAAPSASNNTPVVLNEVAHSIFYAPMYVAIEEGYFAQEGIDLTLVTGFGADKTMTALLTGEADIGFMGSESTIYTYKEGASDYAVNFAQLTQRAGNFLVSREPIEDFTWDMVIGKEILGGRAGGMPEMVFEYILKKNDIDPAADLSIDQSIDFGSTAAAFSGGQGDFSVVCAFYYTISFLLKVLTFHSPFQCGPRLCADNAIYHEPVLCLICFDCIFGLSTEITVDFPDVVAICHEALLEIGYIRPSASFFE